jgi:hypothetical protein
MSSDKLRRQITSEAARLLYNLHESEFATARRRASRKMARGWVDADDFPTNAEIRNEIQRLEQVDASRDGDQDRFHVYRALLLPLQHVEQNRRRHPEGDALYHSLQVFELARNANPWDEEFLLAALLHDVGKAIDLYDHVTAGLDALAGFITDRTAWLIANHCEAHKLLDGTIGARAKRRLQRSEDFDELFLLAQCDRDGRVPGGPAPDLDEALDSLRELARLCG